MNNKTFIVVQNPPDFERIAHLKWQKTHNKSNAIIFGVDANIIIFGYRPWCKQPLGLI